MNPPLELRDQLALDRTVLANERTLLAYVRTALGLVGAGAGLLQFGHGVSARLGGWALVVTAVATLAIGLRRYSMVRRLLRTSRLPPPA
jgi:putative membrane protein